MMTTFRLLIFCAICAATAMLLLSACAGPSGSRGSADETVSLPDETRLRARIAEFHNALGSNDIEHRYAMLAPAIREKMTLEQFKRDMRWNGNAARTKMTAALDRACSCAPVQYLRCVLIVDVAVEGAGGKITKERPLEMWEYDGSEWYWGYMGVESRGRCPGEH